MNRNNTWRWALVVFLVAWSLYEIYPPEDRDLLEVFKEEAVTTDSTLSNIVQRAEALRAEDKQKGAGDHIYQNLLQAAGTNDLQKIFTTYDVAKEKDPNRAILNRLQRKASGKIRLGLDLRGGTSFLMGMDTSKLETNRTDKAFALGQAVEVLRRRVDRLGVAEPVLQPAGEDRILVQLPGVSEADKEMYRQILTNTAYLELRMVHPDSERLIAQGIIEPGYEKMVMATKRRDNRAPEALLVKKKSERGFSGKYISQAFADRDPVSNRPMVSFRLNTQGAELFGQITTENVGKRMAIVLDKELMSAPVIQTPITQGSAQITGDFTAEEANELANVLQNPLEAPVKVLEERSVDPSLGKDTIRSGIMAAIGGVVLVAGFMAVYYFFAGVVANVALILNIIILMGVMCSVGTTLTLPGIAGIVLTVGMAVDANVLIFERLREELAKGKSLRGALAAGYDRAFSVIFDSHVTTLISSIILIFMGTGSVKGFGVTLTIGVAASLFTALVVTRLVFDFMLQRDKLKSLKMLHIIRGTQIDFMRWAKPAFILSWTIIAIGLGVGVMRGDKLMGIDFAGGDNITLRFDQGHKIDPDKLREAITKAGLADPIIQYQKDLAGTAETLRVTTEVGKGKQVENILSSKFPEAKFDEAALDTVGPIIGEEIKQTAVVASILSLFGILVYVAFRYEFSFAIGAVVAVIHDVLMTIGCYCIANYISGRQFNATVVAALLTIIGFSINDTVVIFDRIREDLKLGVRGTFRELINQALNQTLSRTIITSGTVFLATSSLYFLGGGAINDFAYTFLVGIITGTYSSIYIASALVLWWHKGERPKMGGASPTVESRPEVKV